MTELFLKKLTDFGLSNKEAKIYITVLKLQLATTTEIAKTTGINRSSTYVVLESLKKKGYIGISDDKKIRKYVAASPDILLYTAKTMAEKQEKIKAGMEAIIPELRTLHKDIRYKPIIKAYEGKSGLIAVLEDTLNCKEKVVRITSSVDKISKLLPAGYFPKYVKQRIEKGIRMYGIHPINETTRQLMKMNVPKFDEPLLVSKEKYKASADMAIYDDKIGYMSSENGGFSITIESKELAEVMKNIFDMAWKEAKRLNKNLTKK